jgi:heptosyltransferase-2
VNKKSEIQLVHEALELGDYHRDDYNLPLSTIEEKVMLARKLTWTFEPSQPIIGFNTGCSDVIPYKKWTVDFHRQLITALTNMGYKNLVLLGGPEDEERNRQIADGLPVLMSDCRSGLRDGLTSVAACDIVISGDSLGMHMAISQHKQVLAWFGPTCAHEIELYGRGEALLSKASCSPCWKRSCNKDLMCYDQVPISDVIEAVKRSEEKWKNQYSSSRLPFSEISSFR